MVCAPCLHYGGAVDSLYGKPDHGKELDASCGEPDVGNTPSYATLDDWHSFISCLLLPPKPCYTLGTEIGLSHSMLYENVPYKNQHAAGVPHIVCRFLSSFAAQLVLAFLRLSRSSAFLYAVMSPKGERLEPTVPKGTPTRCPISALIPILAFYPPAPARIHPAWDPVR